MSWSLLPTSVRPKVASCTFSCCNVPYENSFGITDDELAQADRYEVDAYARVEGNFDSGATAWIYADASDID